MPRIVPIGSGVPNSVMPKGVEHAGQHRVRPSGAGAEFSDAERR